MRLALGGTIRKGDTILATTWSIAAQLTGLCRRRGATLLVSFHGSDITSLKAPTRAFNRVCDQSVMRIAMSHFMLNELQRLGQDGCVIPSPVLSGPQLREAGETPSTWICIARATPLKGIERFIRIVAAAGVEGHVVGGGSELARFQRLAVDLGVQDRVLFHGHVPRKQVEILLGQSDLCVLLPTIREDGSGAEGLGLVLLEAAAQGVACVGCATGGVPEALGPGLVLDDPDDANQSVLAIQGWWDPTRGQEARDWVIRTHGVEKAVRAVVDALSLLG